MGFYKERYIVKRANMRYARNSKLLKIDELAELIGVTHGTCRNFLSANQTISLNLAQKVAKILDKTIDELFYTIGD